MGLTLLPAQASFDRLQHPVKADGSLSILVVGDWGRKGLYNQTQVALQMGIIGEEKEIEFVISVGDNFYNDGLSGVEDSAFEESFTNIYTAPSLQKPWFAILGNHDYRGDALAQFSPLLRQRDERWLCLRSYVVNTEVAEFFFIDTTPFEDKYFTDAEETKHPFDWRGVLPREKYLSQQLKDLDDALKESSARWKIVVGHHTIQSAGTHGNTQELVHSLLPVLQANDVDFYINGHDHCLEHISSSDSALQFLTSGGGSKAWKNDIHLINPPEKLRFYYDGQGFMTMQITPSNVDFQFYDIFGHILHKWNATKALYSM